MCAIVVYSKTLPQYFPSCSSYTKVIFLILLNVRINKSTLQPPKGYRKFVARIYFKITGGARSNQKRKLQTVELHAKYYFAMSLI